MTELNIGDIINNKYRIDSVLGEGGMGTVFKAREIGLDRNVALKVPKAAVIRNKDFMARFSREAKLVAKLTHDNIVQVYEFYSHPDLVFMALEFVKGVELTQLVKRPPTDLKVGQVLDVIQKACDGLAYAHEQGIVHRDIKPANIMVSRNRDGSFRVKVMDFGIAHVADGQLFTQQLTELTQAGAAMGTPSYMSPEQVEGQKVSPASDIYSMACVIFYCFTLRTLFEGSLFTIISQHVNSPPPDPTLLNPNLPESFANALMKGLSKRAEDRYHNAHELGHAIAEALKGQRDHLFVDLLPPGAVDDAEPIAHIGGQTPSHGTLPQRPVEVPSSEGEDDIFETVETPSTRAAHGTPSPSITSGGLPTRAAGPRSLGQQDITGPTISFGTRANTQAVGQTSTLAPQQHFEATSMLPPGALTGAQPKGTKPTGLAWVLMLVVLMVLGGGGFAAYVTLFAKPDTRQIRTLLAAGNWSEALAMLPDLPDSVRADAEQLVAASLDERFEQVQRQFERKDVTAFTNNIDHALAFGRAANELKIPRAAKSVRALETLERARVDLERHRRLLDTHSITAPNDAAAEVFAANANSLLERVAGAVSADFAAVIQEDIANVRARVVRIPGPGELAQPSPTPRAPATPTPSIEEQNESYFRRLAAEAEDASIPIARRISDLQSFIRRAPDAPQAGEAQRLVERLERQRLTTPEMVRIDSWLTFTRGSDESSGRPDERPQHNVEIRPFAIARHEVTAAAFALFLNEVGNPDNSYFEPREEATIRGDNGRFGAHEGASEYPANYVTWAGALAYTQWLSAETGRKFDLPTEAEWERAAQGFHGGRLYPWGDDIGVNRARYGQALPDRPPFYAVMRPVNSLPEGASEEGLLHMAGNVAEWVKDIYGPYDAASFQSNPTGADVGRLRVVRGGGWESTADDLRVRARERKNPEFGFADVGFRIVERF